jgi:hypothetical protein
MGHFLFLVLHLIALFFGMVGLFLTIPLHLIYAATKGNRPKPSRSDPEAPNPNTHVRCPDCRELVRMDASKCKHCGTTLVPQAPPPATSKISIDAKAMLITAMIAAAVIAMFAMATP